MPHSAVTALALAAPLAAQGTLVVDLHPGGPGPGHGYFDGRGIALGDRLLFSGNDGVLEEELWISDGTAAGTQLVLEIHPTGNGRPRDFTALGDAVLFVAADEAGGGLWRTDGTAAGTTKLAAPTAGIGWLNGLVRLGDAVYFHAQTVGEDAELWKTDGTAVGTVPVTTIGYLGDGPDNSPIFVPFGSELYFLPVTDVGTDLWKTDGTAAGTVLVVDFEPTAEPDDLLVAGDRLFFTAFLASTGRELWSTDGTSAGTGIVKDLTLGPTSSTPVKMAALDDGTLLVSNFPGLFGGPPRLWASDGTTAGTVPIFQGGELQTVIDIISVGDEAFFFPDVEMWRTDGTAAGTEKAGGPLIHAENFYAFEPAIVGGGEHVVLPVKDYFGVTGIEPWSTDGTGAGILVDIAPGSASSHPKGFVRAGNKVFFSANDGVTDRELHAIEIAEIGAWVGSAYGSGCGVGALAPALSAAREITVGSDFQITLANAAPAAPAFLFVGARPDVVDLGGGCTLYLESPLLLLELATDAGGALALPLSVPSAAGLVGQPFYFQYVTLVAGGPLGGLAETTNGLEIIAGP